MFYSADRRSSVTPVATHHQALPDLDAGALRIRKVEGLPVSSRSVADPDVLGDVHPVRGQVGPDGGFVEFLQPQADVVQRPATAVVVVVAVAVRFPAPERPGPVDEIDQGAPGVQVNHPEFFVALGDPASQNGLVPPGHALEVVDPQDHVVDSVDVDRIVAQVVVVVVVVVAFVLCQRRRITLCVCVCVGDHVCARVCRRRACGVRADSKNKGVATRGTKHHQTSDLKKKERAQETRTRFHHNR
eukprot:CAMPEP_0201117948 /NCGR_PEP_ID=MMETSP0850-20130426/2025_1 /ASSEMBLY_ACC=CAM_ASM_000622 /TAXON_ID=183588 /ORGANISM="Pseudo-nitzschia fraudulenta, Strain WWA7" /LENGTH=243 /DNA_ID=CAMNT_0047382767 /DNA_START=396 /DNA_END=1131 /DNA_ORIENTATION=+